ncbi:MAG: dienelactone hydrolase family protein [Alkalispirochaeta sp.]
MDTTPFADALAAVITLYGSGPIQTLDALEKMPKKGSVPGIFGAKDPSTSLTEVTGFENALTDDGAENTITFYDGVGHALVKGDIYDQGGAAHLLSRAGAPTQLSSSGLRL